ncbi:MAG: hypothetical protein ABEJ35_07000 [Halobacteriaceae archaeon]
MGDEHGEEPDWKRVTAPQQPYSTREVALGAGVLVVGLLVTVVLPVVAA